MTDTDKVLDFLQKIGEQLGPVGVQAYNIVKSRVLSEAIVFSGLGLFALIVGVATATWCFKWAINHKRTKQYHDDKDEMAAFLGICISIASVIVFASTVIPSAINLISPDYATIERILNLVGSAR